VDDTRPVDGGRVASPRCAQAEAAAFGAALPPEADDAEDEEEEVEAVDDEVSDEELAALPDLAVSPDEEDERLSVR
jgi:hypothetical protein